MKVLDWVNPETQNIISIVAEHIVAIDRRVGLKNEDGTWMENSMPVVQVMTTSFCVHRLFESNEEAQVEYERVLAVIAAA